MKILETSLVVKWLRLPASNAEGKSLIPVWGVKIPYAVWPKKENPRHLFFDLLKSVSLLRHFPVDLIQVPPPN